MIRSTITFIGSVQGVGFRYTTINVAQGYDVAGWVRNEPDGSVKCVVEGETGEVDRFIAAVKQAMEGHISDARIETSPASGEFNGFAIRR